jgi:hypothetical protein
MDKLQPQHYSYGIELSKLRDHFRQNSEGLGEPTTDPAMNYLAGGI